MRDGWWKQRKTKGDYVVFVEHINAYNSPFKKVEGGRALKLDPTALA